VTNKERAALPSRKAKSVSSRLNAVAVKLRTPNAAVAAEALFAVRNNHPANIPTNGCRVL
jgi:hypothetical protein